MSSNLNALEELAESAKLVDITNVRNFLNKYNLTMNDEQMSKLHNGWLAYFKAPDNYAIYENMVLSYAKDIINNGCYKKSNIADFNVKDYVYNTLKQNKKFIGHVATQSYNSGISCTPLSLILFNDNIVCATDLNFNHTKNISLNNEAVISLDYGFQLTCKAEIVGHVLDSNNEDIVRLYKELYPRNWEKYSNIENQVFIIFSIKFIKIWRYINDIPYQGEYYISDDFNSVVEYKPKRISS